MTYRPQQVPLCHMQSDTREDTDRDAAEHAHSNFTGDLEHLLQAAFYCAAQGAQDTSKVDMFQTLKKKFIENYGYLP